MSDPTPITGPQRRTIFDLCRKLDFDDRARHDFQREACGKASLKQFTKLDAARLIDELVRLGGIKPKRARTRPRKLPDNVVQFINPKQRRKIEVMASQVAWREEDGFERWMLASFGFRHPRTNAEVTKVIHGLESLRVQQRKKRRA